MASKSPNTSKKQNSKIRLSHTVACAGCAAKLSPVLLREALKSFISTQSSDPNLLVGTNTLDDAGVYLLSPNLAIINTTDFFPPIVDDPILFGRIAAANALSDVYAMGGEVKTVMNLVSFPKTMPLEILGEILQGAEEKVKESGGVTVGGHTVATETLLFGLAVTGVIDPKDLTTNAAAKSGDALILTKPLGTGIITTAIKNDAIPESSGLEAFSNMSLLNAMGARIMRRFHVHSATDITGFGLLGHAMQMADASNCSFEIIGREVPLMDRVLELAEQDMVPGALENNKGYVSQKLQVTGRVSDILLTTFFDPQTSGGLLMSVDQTKADEIVRELRAEGYVKASIIGGVIPRKEKTLIVR